MTTDRDKMLIALTLEQAAKVCDLEAAASSLEHKQKAVWQSEVAGRCSAAIRSMK